MDKKESREAAVVLEENHKRSHSAWMERLMVLATVLAGDKGKMKTQIRTQKTRAGTTRKKLRRRKQIL